MYLWQFKFEQAYNTNSRNKFVELFSDVTSFLFI